VQRPRFWWTGLCAAFAWLGVAALTVWWLDADDYERTALLGTLPRRPRSRPVLFTHNLTWHNLTWP